MSGGVCDKPGERCYHPISCERGGCVKLRYPKPAKTDVEQRMRDMVVEEDRAVAAKAVTPQAAHCSACGHSWIVAYLPMPLERFAALGKAARCPKGCRSPVMLGTGA